MSDFLTTLGTEVGTYLEAWEPYAQELRPLGDPSGDYIPNAIGWKVESIESFNDLLSRLISENLISQIHIGEVDGRYIASVVLANPIDGIPLLKLMQKRPGSSDPAGLDHIDFWASFDAFDPKVIEITLAQMGVECEMESNDSHRWISIRFGEKEAKVVGGTVLEVCSDQLNAANTGILDNM